MEKNKEKETSSKTTEPKNDSTDSKEGLALIVGGLLVLGIFFLTYRYFNAQNDIKPTDPKTSSAKTDRKDDDKNSDTKTNDKDTKTAEKPTPDGNKPIGTSMGGWKANDYKSGDIQKGNYTVQSGDTLWEIAEAVYGNGAQWTQILNANAGSIGYLPCGQQALIVPGQVLVL